VNKSLRSPILENPPKKDKNPKVTSPQQEAARANPASPKKTGTVANETRDALNRVFNEIMGN
jgi:hypothetical protein